MQKEQKKVTHKGGCHCGAVRFEVAAPAEIEVLACNCSICNKVGFLHLIATADDFKITKGEDKLTEYRFNTGTARHLFCSVCGVKSFYIPRSHPDGWSVNARCLDMDTVEKTTITDYDGANWEASIHKIT
ncbi:GFA family protein [Kordiimonas pumila]|uniref:GFA family protein n=1 Tax=Kordiimonas pumila TaxID=2161677 RepID=A0ABV7D135_9PROT|nr:GFA family protein [Kordiimonas pumila]